MEKIQHGRLRQLLAVAAAAALASCSSDPLTPSAALNGIQARAAVSATGCATVLCVTVDEPQWVRNDNKDNLVATAVIEGGFPAGGSVSTLDGTGNFANYSVSTIPIVCGSASYTSNQARTWTRVTTSYADPKYTVTSGDESWPDQAPVSGGLTLTRNISKPASDGSYTVSFTVTPEQKRTVTTEHFREYRYKSGGTYVYDGCSEWTSIPAGATAYDATGPADDTKIEAPITSSASYVVDLLPGVFDGEVTATSATTGMGGDFTVKGKVIGASAANQAFKLSIKASLGDTYSFTNSIQQVTRDIAKNNEPPSFGYDWSQAGLVASVPCSAALGTYKISAIVEGLTDIEGYPFDPSSSDLAPDVTVESSVQMVNTTTVYGWVTDLSGATSYIDLSGSGFTATGSKRAVNTTPGAFHATQLLKHNGKCNGDVSVTFNIGNTYDLELDAPAGFDFVKTGQTYAKVYAGMPGQLFDFEKPVLSGISSTGEVTGLLGANFEALSTDGRTLKVKLDRLGSQVKGDHKVFLRARVRYSGTAVPNPGQAFLFTGRAHADGYNGAAPGADKTNSFTLYHAPVPPSP